MRTRGFLIRIIYTLTITLTAITSVLLLDKLFFRINFVNLESEISFDRDFYEVAGFTKNSSYLFLDTNSIKEKLLKEPLVSRVFVNKKFPDILNITVYGRKALAIAYTDRDGVSTPLCFDENGVLFKEGGEVEDIDLPIIGGDMDFSNVRKGGVLPEAIIPLLGNLKSIRADNPQVYSSISEISIIKKGNMTFDMTLYFTFTPIKALVGQDITTEQLESIIVVNSLLQRDKVAVDEVDFRSKEIIYKEKG